MKPVAGPAVRREREREDTRETLSSCRVSGFRKRPKESPARALRLDADWKSALRLGSVECTSRGMTRIAERRGCAFELLK